MCVCVKDDKYLLKFRFEIPSDCRENCKKGYTFFAAPVVQDFVYTGALATGFGMFCTYGAGHLQYINKTRMYIPKNLSADSPTVMKSVVDFCCFNKLRGCARHKSKDLLRCIMAHNKQISLL